MAAFHILPKFKSSIFLLRKSQSWNIMQSFNWKKSFIIVFTRLLVKNLMKKLSISNKNAYGTFQDISHYIILACENFLVLK